MSEKDKLKNLKENSPDSLTEWMDVMYDVIYVDDEGRSPFYDIKRFIECDSESIAAEIDEAEWMASSMDSVLVELGVISESQNILDFEDINKLAEMVGVPGVPDADSDPDNPEDNKKFIQFMSEFIERLYRSDRFWELVDERSSRDKYLIRKMFDEGIYGRNRQHIRHLEEVRAVLAELIQLSGEQEAKLQKKIDDFE